MTCDTWHVKHDMWHMTCDTWHVTHDMWHMTCDIWHVTHDMWHKTCDTWHVTHDMRHMTYDTWHVKYVKNKLSKKFRSKALGDRGFKIFSQRMTDWVIQSHSRFSTAVALGELCHFGQFNWKSQKRTFYKMCQKKAQKCLVPAVTWCHSNW